MTNTAELEGAIAKSGKSKKEIAAALALSEAGLWKKITNQSEFKATEIKKIQSLLSLSAAERDLIFLHNKVILNHYISKSEVMKKMTEIKICRDANKALRRNVDLQRMSVFVETKKELNARLMELPSGDLEKLAKLNKLFDEIIDDELKKL